MFPVIPDRFIQNIHHAPLNELILINSEYLTPYLTFIKEHKAVYKAAFKNPVCMQAEAQFASISNHVLIPILNRFEIPEQFHAYWISFYIRGCMAIIQEWINRNCVEPIEEIVRILIACIRPESGR